MDEPHTLSDAVESAQRWLRLHRTRSRVTMHRAVEDVEYIIAEAARCVDVIRDAAPALGMHPGVVTWAEQTADGIIAIARAHLEVRRAVAERRAESRRRQAEELAAAEAADRARAEAREQARLAAERARAEERDRLAAERRALIDARRAESAASFMRTRGGPNNTLGTYPVRWMAWVGDEIAVTIDGETALGTVTSISRGPVLHVTLTDDRVIALAIGARKERPKRRSPRKPESSKENSK